MPSADILFFHGNLLHVPDIKMYSRVRCRSVCFPGACKQNAAARWRLPAKKMRGAQNSSEVASAQRHSIVQVPRKLHRPKPRSCLHFNTL